MWQGYQRGPPPPYSLPQQHQPPPLRPEYNPAAHGQSATVYFQHYPDSSSTSDLSQAAEQWAKMQAEQQSRQFGYGTPTAGQPVAHHPTWPVNQEFRPPQPFDHQNSAYGYEQPWNQHRMQHPPHPPHPPLSQPTWNQNQQPPVHHNPGLEMQPGHGHPNQFPPPQLPPSVPSHFQQGPHRMPSGVMPPQPYQDPNFQRFRPPPQQINQFSNPVWPPLEAAPQQPFPLHDQYKVHHSYEEDISVDYNEGSADLGHSYPGTAYANFDFESVAQSHSAEAIKKLPSWIREGLEKLEREKQKEREKQRFMQEYEARIKDDPDKPKWSESESSSSSRTPSPERDRLWKEGERQETLVRATKEMVTDILMIATNRVLEKACAGEIESRKQRGHSIQSTAVPKSAALAALAQFGDSDSDEGGPDPSGLPPPPVGVLKARATAQKTAELDVKDRIETESRSPSPVDSKVKTKPTSEHGRQSSRTNSTRSRRSPSSSSESSHRIRKPQAGSSKYSKDSKRKSRSRSKEHRKRDISPERRKKGSPRRSVDDGRGTRRLEKRRRSSTSSSSPDSRQGRRTERRESKPSRERTPSLRRAASPLNAPTRKSSLSSQEKVDRSRNTTDSRSNRNDRSSKERPGYKSSDDDERRKPSDSRSNRNGEFNKERRGRINSSDEERRKPFRQDSTSKKSSRIEKLNESDIIRTSSGNRKKESDSSNRPAEKDQSERSRNNSVNSKSSNDKDRTDNRRKNPDKSKVDIEGDLRSGIRYT